MKITFLKRLYVSNCFEKFWEEKIVSATWALAFNGSTKYDKLKKTLFIVILSWKYIYLYDGIQFIPRKKLF